MSFYSHINQLSPFMKSNDDLIPFKELVYKIKNELMDPLSKAILTHKEQYHKYSDALSTYSSETEELLRKTISDLELKHQEELSIQQINNDAKINSLHSEHDEYVKRVNHIADELIARIETIQQQHIEQLNSLKESVRALSAIRNDDSNDRPNDSTNDGSSNDSNNNMNNESNDDMNGKPNDRSSNESNDESNDGSNDNLTDRSNNESVTYDSAKFDCKRNISLEEDTNESIFPASSLVDTALSGSSDDDDDSKPPPPTPEIAYPAL